MDEDKKSEIKDLLARITKLIEEVLDEKDTVEEISTGWSPRKLRYATKEKHPQKDCAT